MELVGHIALLPDLSLVSGKRVVLGENGEGSCELLEEVVLAFGHLLDIGLGPLVCGKLVVHHHQTLVVQDVPVVVVVEDHGGTTVIPHVLDCLGVRDGIRALLEHVRDMVWVQSWVYFWVQTVHQLHTVCSSNTVSSYIWLHKNNN